MQGHTHTLTQLMTTYFTIGKKIVKKIQEDHPNFHYKFMERSQRGYNGKKLHSLSGKKLLWKLVQRGRFEQEKPCCPLL